MVLGSSDLIMLALGAAAALWCVGLALVLVQTDSSDRRLWLSSALVGFAMILMMARKADRPR